MSGALQHPTLWPVLILLKVWLCPAMTTDDNLWGSSCGESHSEPVVPEGPAPSAWSQLTSCQPHGPGLPAQTCCSSRGSLLPLVDVMVALQIKWMSSGRAAGQIDGWARLVQACLFIHPSTIHLPFHIFTYLPIHPLTHPSTHLLPAHRFTHLSILHLSIHLPFIRPLPTHPSTVHLPVHPALNLPSDIYQYTHPSMYPSSVHSPFHPSSSIYYLSLLSIHLLPIHPALNLLPNIYVPVHASIQLSSQYPLTLPSIHQHPSIHLCPFYHPGHLSTICLSTYPSIPLLILHSSSSYPSTYPPTTHPEHFFCIGVQVLHCWASSPWVSSEGPSCILGYLEVPQRTNS